MGKRVTSCGAHTRIGRTLALAIAASVVATPALTGNADSLRALLAAYRCEVVGRLELIYDTGNPASHAKRFIAINNVQHPHGYVQCMFYDHRSKMLCEASSGFYFDPPGAPRTLRLDAYAVSALARLSFSTDDSEGNFQKVFDVDDPPDFNAIADFMLTVLHDGYGARAHSALNFNAPFARHGTSSCIPMS